MDGLFIGPSDLAAGFGHLGNPGHPEVQQAMAAVFAAAKRAGKPMGILAPVEADARRRFRRDVDFVRVDGAVAIAIDHVARHVWVAAVHVPEHVLVGDEPRGVGEDGSAGRVIEMTVAVDHVPHRHGEAARQFVLQPYRERGIDRVAEDDAVARDQKDRVPVAVPGSIQIAGERNDLARRSSRLRLQDGQRGDERREQGSEAGVCTGSHCQRFLGATL